MVWQAQAAGNGRVGPDMAATPESGIRDVRKGKRANGSIPAGSGGKRRNRIAMPMARVSYRERVDMAFPIIAPPVHIQRGGVSPHRADLVAVKCGMVWPTVIAAGVGAGLAIVTAYECHWSGVLPWWGKAMSG